MIGTFFKTFFLSLLAVALSWAFALREPLADSTFDQELDRIVAAVPHPDLLRSIAERSLAARTLPEEILSPLPEGPLLSRVRLGTSIAAIHFYLVLSQLPALLILLGAGLCLGLWARERTRHGTSYASPSQAYIGKHLAVCSTVTLTLMATTPLALPLVTFWLSTLVLAGGIALYAGNLPVKL